MLAVLLDEGIDLALEVGHGIEGAAADGLVGDQGESVFGLMEPGAVGRGEVQMEARVLGQPGANSGGFVGGVVVVDPMHVQGHRHLRFDLPQKGQELLMPVLGLALREDTAVGRVQRGKQGLFSMPHVVVGHALDVPKANHLELFTTGRRCFQFPRNSWHT